MGLNNESRGALVVFEGLDSCGKTSLCGRLLSYLEGLDHSIKLWRFPDGTTSVGRMISAYLTNKSQLDDCTIHLLQCKSLGEEKAAERGGYGGERYEQLEFRRKVAQHNKLPEDSSWKRKTLNRNPNRETAAPTLKAEERRKKKRIIIAHMALTISLFPSPYACKTPPIIHQPFNAYPSAIKTSHILSNLGPTPILCTAKPSTNNLKTCKNCKTQFDPLLNHLRACRFHTAHFGGETKRKFESVYAGGTMDTPDSGEVFQYWHCCGSEDPFDPGCTAAPHASYDD